MKAKYILLGISLLGILFFSVSYAYGFEGEEGGGGDELPDDDGDGIDDNKEDEEKRIIEIWIGDNVVEIASIKRSEEQKDIIELRVGYNEDGLSVRVSYGTIVYCDPPEEDLPPEEEPKPSGGDYCEDYIEYKITFEVFFQGLIEFIDLNDNGVLDEEEDEIVSDYWFSSFQPVEYSLTPISNDTNLHYLLFNSTDGIFAAHVYLVEEFVYVNDNLISPTEAKIDIEITGYEYVEDNSQLALITNLWSEEHGIEGEETYDEKEGYSEDEKDVVVKDDAYSGFFSWKETALVDGVEMDVLTKELDYEGENFQKLLICYPRGYHIFHDPKIGIFIGQVSNGTSPLVITGAVISVVGVCVITVIVLRKRRIL
ncbi:MAG: hypothetical protein ACFFEN_04265 [Candidatus Thorarchaeota archaeon]